MIYLDSASLCAMKHAWKIHEPCMTQQWSAVWFAAWFTDSLFINKLLLRKSTNHFHSLSHECTITKLWISSFLYYFMNLSTDVWDWQLTQLVTHHIVYIIIAYFCCLNQLPIELVNRQVLLCIVFNFIKHRLICTKGDETKHKPGINIDKWRKSNLIILAKILLLFMYA